MWAYPRLYSKFESEDLGWPKFDPPLYVYNHWVDEEGEEHYEDPERKEYCPRCELDFEKMPPVRISVTPAKKISDIVSVIQQGEGETVEFKEDIPTDAGKLSKIIASFANTYGGKIFLGVDNEGNIKGFNDIDTPAGREALQKRIRGLVDRIHPKVNIRMDFYDDEQGLNIAVITVIRGTTPLHLVDDKVYIRVLEESRPATAEEIVNLATRNSPGVNK